MTWSRYFGSSWEIALAVAGAISLEKKFIKSDVCNCSEFTLVWWLHSCQRQWPATSGQGRAGVGSSRHLGTIVPPSRGCHLWRGQPRTARGGWGPCPRESAVTLEHSWEREGARINWHDLTTQECSRVFCPVVNFPQKTNDIVPMKNEL